MLFETPDVDVPASARIWGLGWEEGRAQIEKPLLFAQKAAIWYNP
jgi:hypothetical protein